MNGDYGGLTFHEVMVALGYQYMVAHVQVPRPPYGRKWMTRRAVRWRRSHPIRWEPEMVAWKAGDDTPVAVRIGQAEATMREAMIAVQDGLLER